MASCLLTLPKGTNERRLYSPATIQLHNSPRYGRAPVCRIEYQRPVLRQQTSTSIADGCICQLLKSSQAHVSSGKLVQFVCLRTSRVTKPRPLLHVSRLRIITCPAWPGHPLSPLSLHFPVFCSYLLSPFLDGFNYFLFLAIPFPSTRIVPLRFQAGGRRKRPNLGLVCCVYIVFSVFQDGFWCFAVFGLVQSCVFLRCFDTVGWVI